MPRVFTWYQLPEDESDLFRYIDKSGEVKIIPLSDSRRPQDVVEITICEFLLGTAYSGGSIVLSGTLTKAGVTAYGDSSNLTYGLPFSAEEVSYQRVFPVDGKLGASNLCAYWQYLSDDKSELVDKSPEFRKWASRILTWARRHAPEKLEYNGYPYPATTRAAAAFKRREFKTAL